MSELSYLSYYGEKNVTRTLHKVSDLHGFNFEQKIANQLENQGSCSLLDIGSGNSSFTLELARKFPEASFYTVDICSDTVRGFRASQRPKNIMFDVQDGNALEFPNNMFDLIAATWSVSKYLPDDFSSRPTTYITEIARVLKTNGIASIRPELSLFTFMPLDIIRSKLEEADYPNKDTITRKITDYQIAIRSGVSVQFLSDPNRARMTKYI